MPAGDVASRSLGQGSAAERLLPAARTCPRAACYREPAVSLVMTSLRLNEPGLARGGNSLKLWSHRATMAVAGRQHERMLDAPVVVALPAPVRLLERIGSGG